MKNTTTSKKLLPVSTAKSSKKPKREHWTVQFFKRVDAWGDALKEPENKQSRV